MCLLLSFHDPYYTDPCAQALDADHAREIQGGGIEGRMCATPPLADGEALVHRAIILPFGMPRNASCSCGVTLSRSAPHILRPARSSVVVENAVALWQHTEPTHTEPASYLHVGA